MVKLLEESDVDEIAESIDVELSLAEERQAAALGQYREHDGSDLSDGGRVGEASLHPTEGGKRVEKGRPSARRAWTWDGTETVLPLAWNPDGTSHDGGRRYLTKRHCICCGISGFRGNQCRECDYNNCTKCNRGTDRSKIIPCFYLKKDDVPYAQRTYGSIPCFLQFCPRSGTQGFQTEEDMRLHARSRHRLEYAAMIESQQANQKNEVEKLQEQINALMATALGNRSRMAEVLAAPGPLEMPTQRMPEPVAPEVAVKEVVVPDHPHKYRGKQIGGECVIKGCLATRKLAFKKRK